MPERRVVIPGIGVISALGRNRSEFWDSLRRGCSGIGPIAAVECTGLRFQNGAEVPGFNPLDHFDERSIDFLDRFAQFALVAAREAVQDARCDPRSRPERTAIVTGSC